LTTVFLAGAFAAFLAGAFVALTAAGVGFGAGPLAVFLAVGLTSAADRGWAPTYRAVADQAQANSDQHPADALALGLPLAAGGGALVHRGRPVVGERL
jgi:membrane protein required for beta-lactamase induction